MAKRFEMLDILADKRRYPDSCGRKVEASVATVKASPYWALSFFFFRNGSCAGHHNVLPENYLWFASVFRESTHRYPVPRAGFAFGQGLLSEGLSARSCKLQVIQIDVTCTIQSPAMQSWSIFIVS